jgi:hypothetical protein
MIQAWQLLEESLLYTTAGTECCGIMLLGMCALCLFNWNIKSPLLEHSGNHSADDEGQGHPWMSQNLPIGHIPTKVTVKLSWGAMFSSMQSTADKWLVSECVSESMSFQFTSVDCREDMNISELWYWCEIMSEHGAVSGSINGYGWWGTNSWK